MAAYESQTPDFYHTPLALRDEQLQGMPYQNKFSRPAKAPESAWEFSAAPDSLELDTPESHRFVNENTAWALGMLGSIDLVKKYEINPRYSLFDSLKQVVTGNSVTTELVPAGELVSVTSLTQRERLRSNSEDTYQQLVSRIAA